MLRCCYIIGWGFGGVGWGNNVHVTCVHAWCYVAATSLVGVWVGRLSPYMKQAFTHSKQIHTAGFHRQQRFTHSKLLLTKVFLHTEATGALHTARFYTQKLLHTASIFTQQTLSHSKHFHTAGFHTQHVFTHKSFYLHTEAFTHSKHFHTANIFTQQAFSHSKHLHTAGFHRQQRFTHSKRLHWEAFTHSRLSHTASLYTQELLQTEAFTRSKPLHSKLLQTEAFTRSKHPLSNWGGRVGGWHFVDTKLKSGGGGPLQNHKQESDQTLHSLQNPSLQPHFFPESACEGFSVKKQPF